MPAAWLVVVVGLGVASSAGCGGGSEHPAPSGETSSSAELAGSGYDAQEAAAARVRAAACRPGTVRECRHYYLRDGQLNCPMSVQFCRASGDGWLPCAEPYDGK